MEDAPENSSVFVCVCWWVGVSVCLSVWKCVWTSHMTWEEEFLLSTTLYVKWMSTYTCMCGYTVLHVCRHDRLSCQIWMSVSECMSLLCWFVSSFVKRVSSPFLPVCAEGSLEVSSFAWSFLMEMHSKVGEAPIMRPSMECMAHIKHFTHPALIHGWRQPWPPHLVCIVPSGKPALMES